MAEAEYFVGEPSVDRAAQLIEFASKEMIDAFDDREMIASRERGDKRFDFFEGAVFVLAPVDKKFGFIALAQE